MALKPTIYKFRIALTDINRDYYDSFNLTVAQHPSENEERMMARIVAFCLNAHQDLQFTKGLSSIEEPDIWLKTLDDQIELWIEAGEPDPERVKKATRLAKQVKIYSFNNKSDVWWKQNQSKLSALNVNIVRLDYQGIQAFSQMIARTLDLGIMLSGNTAYVSSDDKQCEISWETLQE
ncbi:YaeQ family protein [Vibrio aphrogenes]|uniref:YaeQ family protein n=1 Tax=Vibrio aphrogenes TaxID=1891186 RepID=UPI000B3547F5|nr:YaeQ family protein [Vibrio aphrogenes]